MSTLVLCPSSTSLDAILSNNLLLRALRVTAPKARLVELRIDRMPGETPASLKRAIAELGPDKVIVTCRSHEEGGGLPGAPERSLHERLELWATAWKLGAAYVDIERRTLLRNDFLRERLERVRRQQPNKVQLIVSDHDFATCPPLRILRRWRCESEGLGAQHVKQAVTASSAAALLDGMELMQTTAPFRVPLTFVGMGEVGLFTRLLAGRSALGANLSYVALDAPVAKGQPSLAAAERLYALEHVTPQTPVYAVLGGDVTRSGSPALHNHTLRTQSRSGIYVALSSPDDPVAFLRRAQPILNLQGVSVTQPHKCAVLAACDRKEKLVDTSRAANTLFAPRHTELGTRWHADNTDGPGALALLDAAQRRKRTEGPRRVLILGAGGAARTVGAALAETHAQLCFAARRIDAAQALADALGGNALALDDEGQLNKALAQSDLVVQCTPVGTAPATQASLLDEAQLARLARDTVVFETVYTPATTLLLARARRQGLLTLDGLALLRAQGDLQAQRFYGLTRLAVPAADARG